MDTNLGRVVGYDGKQIELSRDSLYIKWRYVGDAVWKNLIALNDLKVGLPKGGKTDQVLAKLSNNDWDYVWKTPESSGGSIDTVQLASVTTAPIAPFPINTKYYNANDNIIYRATEENTWENADTEEPVLGAFYIYDDEIYFYDKKFQSLYMVKTIPSTIFYANKIMESGESSINMEVDLSNSLILSVHVNGHFQTYGKNYTISTENEESTIYFDESVDEDSEVDVVYSSYMELSGGGGVSDYSQLTNKPKINNIELKGNKTSDNLGLQDKLTASQLNAVNSGITSSKVTTYDNYSINKQDTLVSGTNIKTINNESVIGSGNLNIDGLPDQTEKTDKYLKTDGTNASWQDIEIPLSILQEASTVALTGDYNDLINKPTIPTVNDSTITITQGETTKGTFTLNQNSNVTIALDAGGSGESSYYKTTNVSILSTDWITDTSLPGYGYKCDIPCTGVTSDMIPQVYFSDADLQSGNYSSVCESGVDIITIYSKVNDAITIPAILAF